MSKKSFILVALQFSSFIYFGIEGNLLSKGFLLFFQLIGLIIGVWAIITMKLGNFNIQPEVKDRAKFIRKGPYKIIRNPMYLGLLIFFGIAVIEKFTLIRLVVFLILATSLLLKIFSEEQFLEYKFGNAYLDYKQKTYRILPFIF